MTLYKVDIPSTRLQHYLFSFFNLPVGDNNNLLLLFKRYNFSNTVWLREKKQNTAMRKADSTLSSQLKKFAFNQFPILELGMC